MSLKFCIQENRYSDTKTAFSRNQNYITTLSFNRLSAALEAARNYILKILKNTTLSHSETWHWLFDEKKDISHHEALSKNGTGMKSPRAGEAGWEMGIVHRTALGLQLLLKKSYAGLGTRDKQSNPGSHLGKTERFLARNN